MKHTTFLAMALLALLALACKKESNEPDPVATAADYYMLKTGNYWIYEGYQIDSTGVAVSTGEFDSAYIEKDSVINGYTYYKLVEQPFGLGIPVAVFLRDSSGYLVDTAGIRHASETNFTDTLYVDNDLPELYTAFMMMTGRDSVVTVPAGNFTSITARLTVVPSPPNTAGFPTRYVYGVFAKNTGKIKSHTFFYGGDIHLETRMVRCKVAK
jgi:flagellar hook protein FlgE